MTLRHVCFDLDGVLFDSKATMRKAWEISTKNSGVDIPFENYFSLIGRPQEAIFEELRIDKNKWSDLQHDYAQMSRLNPPKIYNGVEELLLSVVSRFTVFSVVTSKPLASARPLVDTLPHVPETLFTPETGLPGKPHPDQLIEVAALYGLDFDSVAYVGDTRIDFEAAESAGVQFLGANWGYGELPAGSDLYSNPDELAEMLRAGN